MILDSISGAGLGVVISAYQSLISMCGGNAGSSMVVGGLKTAGAVLAEELVEGIKEGEFVEILDAAAFAAVDDGKKHRLSHDAPNGQRQPVQADAVQTSTSANGGALQRGHPPSNGASHNYAVAGGWPHASTLKHKDMQYDDSSAASRGAPPHWGYTPANGGPSVESFAHGGGSPSGLPPVHGSHAAHPLHGVPLPGYAAYSNAGPQGPSSPAYGGRYMDIADPKGIETPKRRSKGGAMEPRAEADIIVFASQHTPHSQTSPSSAHMQQQLARTAHQAPALGRPQHALPTQIQMVTMNSPRHGPGVPVLQRHRVVQQQDAAQHASSANDQLQISTIPEPTQFSLGSNQQLKHEEQYMDTHSLGDMAPEPPRAPIRPVHTQRKDANGAKSPAAASGANSPASKAFAW
jgi:hypothetical protein